MRKFAEAYPDFSIVQPLAAQLSWTQKAELKTILKDIQDLTILKKNNH